MGNYRVVSWLSWWHYRVSQWGHFNLKVMLVRDYSLYYSVPPTYVHCIVFNQFLPLSCRMESLLSMLLYQGQICQRLSMQAGWQGRGIGKRLVFMMHV